MQVVAADVGNSSIKFRASSMGDQRSPLASAAGPSGRGVRSIDLRDESIKQEFSALDSIRRDAHWFVSSVSPRNEQLLREQATQRGLVQSWTLLQRSGLPLQIDVEEPDSVGIDRLLAALAAHRRFGLQEHPVSDVIVIDCGTALTIDLIDCQSRFRGGVIMAGPATNLLALSNMTAALPNLSKEKLDQPNCVLGQSTKQAMLSGAWHSGWGAIQQVVAAITELTERPSIVVGTGGGLGPWQDVLPSDWIQVDDLVLDGILIAAEQSIAGLP